MNPATNAFESGLERFVHPNKGDFIGRDAVVAARENGLRWQFATLEVHGVTVGDDAQGEVSVTVEYNGQSFRGHALSTDIVESAAIAYLEVMNRISRRDNAEALSNTAGTAATGTP